MNAKSLMIGDWVHVNPISHRVEPHNSQIGALSRQCNDTICIEGYYNGHFGWSIGEEDVEPIPITEEILKANGIPCDKDFDVWTDYHHLSFGKNLLFGRVYNMDDDNHHEVMMPFKYVHEIQHVLRLCGLDALANNFKIK